MSHDSKCTCTSGVDPFLTNDCLMEKTENISTPPDLLLTMVSMCCNTDTKMRATA